jgi:hypothetical protein
MAKADELETLRKGAARLHAGERKLVEAMIRRSRWFHTTGVVAIVERLGGELVQHGPVSRRVNNFRCPKCRAKVETATAKGVVRVEFARQWFTGARASENRGDHLHCTACGAAFDAPALLRSQWKPTEWRQIGKFLEPWSNHLMPPEQAHTLARYGDRTYQSPNTLEAIRAVLPVEHESKVELCRVFSRFEPIHVADRDEVPWKQVAITPDGTPIDVSWDGESTEDPDERRAITARLDELRREKLLEVERRVESFRRELEAQI